MFVIESNGAAVAAAIRNIMQDLGQHGLTRRQDIRSIVSKGVQSHFEGGRIGGFVGIGARTNTAYDWPDYRSPLTVAEREDKGFDPFPILKMTGDLERGFTTAGKASGHPMGRYGSFFSFSTASASALDKGLVQQYGLDSPNLFHKDGKPVDVPERPFLFWDTDMASTLKNSVQMRFFESVSKHGVKA